MRNSDRILIVIFCFTVSHMALLLTGSTSTMKKGTVMPASSAPATVPATTVDPEAVFVEQFQKQNPNATPAQLQQAIEQFHAKNDANIPAQTGELSNAPSIATTPAPTQSVTVLNTPNTQRRIGKQVAL